MSDMIELTDALTDAKQETELLRAQVEHLSSALEYFNVAEIERLRAREAELVAALNLARGMFLDLERGIATSRVDFNKIKAALKNDRP